MASASSSGGRAVHVPQRSSGPALQEAEPHHQPRNAEASGDPLERIGLSDHLRQIAPRQRRFRQAVLAHALPAGVERTLQAGHRPQGELGGVVIVALGHHDLGEDPDGEGLEHRIGRLVGAENGPIEVGPSDGQPAVAQGSQPGQRVVPVLAVVVARPPGDLLEFRQPRCRPFGPVAAQDPVERLPPQDQGEPPLVARLAGGGQRLVERRLGVAGKAENAVCALHRQGPGEERR